MHYIVKSIMKENTRSYEREWGEFFRLNAQRNVLDKMTLNVKKLF